jgi:aminoglycoside phosphotransferase (APT) family kinase protein
VASLGTVVGLEPLLALEPLAAFLDDAGLGSGAIRAHTLGERHYLVVRDSGDRLVLRSTNGVLREARLLRLLAGAGVPVPEILATCADDDVIGAPFAVMPFVDGHVITETMPVPFYSPGDPVAVATQLVDALVALHAVPVTGELAAFGDLAPQLHVPDTSDVVSDWLIANRPATSEACVVHGAYRLGHAIFAARPAPRLAAILDWERAALGDPLADVGYLTAMWADPGDPLDPMLARSTATLSRWFPRRHQLAERYAERSGRDLSALRWYQVLALWQAASGTTDEHGAAALAARARRLSRG